MASAGCENGSNRSLACEAVGGAQLRASAVGESRGGAAECTGGGVARARSGGFVGWFAQSSQLGLRARLARVQRARRGGICASVTAAIVWRCGQHVGHGCRPQRPHHASSSVFFRSRRPAVRSAAQRPEEQRAAVLNGSVAEGGARWRALERAWPGLSCPWSRVQRREITGGKARATKSSARRIRRSVQGFVAAPASATPVACTLRR